MDDQFVAKVIIFMWIIFGLNFLVVLLMQNVKFVYFYA